METKLSSKVQTHIRKPIFNKITNCNQFLKLLLAQYQQTLLFNHTLKQTMQVLTNKSNAINIPFTKCKASQRKEKFLKLVYNNNCFPVIAIA